MAPFARKQLTHSVAVLLASANSNSVGSTGVVDRLGVKQQPLTFNRGLRLADAAQLLKRVRWLGSEADSLAPLGLRAGSGFGIGHSGPMHHQLVGLVPPATFQHRDLDDATLSVPAVQQRGQHGAWAST